MTSILTTHHHSVTRLRSRRAGTVFVAIAAAAAGWTIGVPLFGVEPTVGLGHRLPPMTIGLGPVIATTLAVSLAGWTSLSALEHLTTKARTGWTAIAITILVVSLVPVIAADADGATKLTLAMLHVVVAAVLIAGLPRRRSPRGER